MLSKHGLQAPHLFEFGAGGKNAFLPPHYKPPLKSVQSTSAYFPLLF